MPVKIPSECLAAYTLEEFILLFYAHPLSPLAELLVGEVKNRDKACVYCVVQTIEPMPLRGPRKAIATWEHIINDASIVTRENIARCCMVILNMNRLVGEMASDFQRSG